MRLLLRLDRSGPLRFAALQGRAAQEYLRAHGLPARDFSTLVFVPDWEGPGRIGYLLRTDGVIGALRACGRGGRALAGLLDLFPTLMRDGAYRIIARWRYRIFGPWRPRPLPDPGWTSRFLE